MYSIQAAKNHAIQLKSMYLDWTRNICYIMLKVYYLGAGMLSDMREFNDVQGLSWTTRELVNSIKVVPFTSSVLVSISISLRFDPSRKCVWLALEFMDGGPSLGVVSSSSFDWVGLGLGGVDANNKHICFPSRDLEIPFFSTKEKRKKMKLLWWILFEETAETDCCSVHTEWKQSFTEWNDEKLQVWSWSDTIS